MRVRSLKDLLTLVADGEGFFANVPSHITPQRLFDVFLSSFRTTPKLLDCDIESIANALRQAAAAGLEIGGITAHAYLVPYGKECTLIPGYKGLIDLARRSGEVKDIYAEVVRQNDAFDYELGDSPRIRHKPLLDDDPESRPVTHVYGVAHLRNGGVQRRVWTWGQIEAHRDRFSQAYRSAERSKKKDSPWHTDPLPMAKKTVLRGMIGSGEVPVSPECRDLVAQDMKVEGITTIEPPVSIGSLEELTKKIAPPKQNGDTEAEEFFDGSLNKPHVVPDRSKAAGAEKEAGGPDEAGASRASQPSAPQEQQQTDVAQPSGAAGPAASKGAGVGDLAQWARDNGGPEYAGPVGSGPSETNITGFLAGCKKISPAPVDTEEARIYCLLLLGKLEACKSADDCEQAADDAAFLIGKATEALQIPKLTDRQIVKLESPIRRVYEEMLGA